MLWTVIPGVTVGSLVLLLGGGRAAPAVHADGSAAVLARLADDGPPGAVPPALDRPRLADSRPALGAGGGRPVPARRPSRPVRLAIPSAGVRARVVAVGAKGRTLAIPPVGRVGWYRAGPRPGEPGHAVIVGHLDTTTGPGVFARLGTLRRGARVRVTDRRGVAHRYRVVGKAVIRKTSFASAGVFGGSRHPVLVLVTCGGDFRRPGGYRDNVLVYARAARA